LVSDSLKKGQYQAKIALRRMQWQAATSGNVTMQIWLGKNMLGQSSTQDSQIGVTQNISIVHYGRADPQT